MSAEDRWLACLDRAITFINGGYADRGIIELANAFYTALNEATGSF